MKAFFDAIVLLLVLRGVVYLLFPGWIQRFIAENIVNLPLNRMKLFGIFQLAIALTIYIYISKHLGG
ncbi:MAG: DUF2065 family protein [Alphaproteobacteria bacterium]|nr:DUF2065 family protein [Alphaproteobacteria bacterium]